MDHAAAFDPKRDGTDAGDGAALSVPDLGGIILAIYTDMAYVGAKTRTQNINVCLPSLRIDAFSLDVMSKVQDVKKSSLTFAPEAGSQRMRNVINKGLTEEIILDGANQAFHGGWNKVKLYFMLGLPLEEEEDRKAIAHLAEKIAENYYDEIPKEQRVGKCQITVSTSFFVPKPFTPFQWARMYTPGDYLGFAKTVNHEIKDMKNQKSIRYNWHHILNCTLPPVGMIVVLGYFCHKEEYRKMDVI